MKNLDPPKKTAEIYRSASAFGDCVEIKVSYIENAGRTAGVKAMIRAMIRKSPGYFRFFGDFREIIFSTASLPRTARPRSRAALTIDSIAFLSCRERAPSSSALSISLASADDEPPSKSIPKYSSIESRCPMCLPEKRS